MEGHRIAVADHKFDAGRPQTLAISWGSLTVATVPWTTASRANSEGMRREDSIWTWASIKPGRI
jgi:hypothetical protein